MKLYELNSIIREGPIAFIGCTPIGLMNTWDTNAYIFLYDLLMAGRLKVSRDRQDTIIRITEDRVWAHLREISWVESSFETDNYGNE